jgi:hypothetical protein
MYLIRDIESVSELYGQSQRERESVCVCACVYIYIGEVEDGCHIFFVFNFIIILLMCTKILINECRR